eukprot:NODE_718_length_4500_cov_0.642127.p1 type:complete len:632 gc:universal NODE_718_length_4500_cov_0.642127:407-2302(+)
MYKPLDRSYELEMFKRTVEYGNSCKERTKSKGDAFIATNHGIPVKSCKEYENYSPITLKEMKLNHVHEKKILVCQTITHPDKRVSIMAIVEDNDANVALLALYNYKSGVSEHQSLPIGSIIGIKNPFLKEFVSGQIGIRVDNPDTILELSPNDPLLISVNWDRPFLGPILNAENFKERGNLEFKNGKFEAAADLYSKGLDLEPTHFNLKSNRSMAYTKSGMLGLAELDLLDLLKIDGAHIKSFLRLIDIYYKMQKYDKSLQYIALLDEVSPNHKEVKNYRLKIPIRIKEQELGEYDFNAMYLESIEELASMNLDHANYENNIEIKTSKFGKGLFATADISIGSLILVSKAISYSKRSKDFVEISVQQDNRLSLGDSLANSQELFRKSRDPFIKQQICLLTGKNQRYKIEELNKDAVFDIAETNAFHLNQTSGVFIYPSFINHSCIPNTFRFFLGDFMIIRAQRNIKQGEELFNLYAPSDGSLEMRRKVFKTFSFECTCELCQLDDRLVKFDFKNNKLKKWLKNQLNKDHSESETDALRLKLIAIYSKQTTIDASQMLKLLRPTPTKILHQVFYSGLMEEIGDREWIDKVYYKGVSIEQIVKNVRLNDEKDLRAYLNSKSEVEAARGIKLNQ